MSPWKDELVEAMNALGGEASLSEIYEQVALIRYPLRGQWQATVRGTLERHSSDSGRFKEGADDLFHAVRGIGSGPWGLR